jgi:CDP-diacylglycerol--glycerol-3-phosphate 3-phosphatidyltransferase
MARPPIHPNLVTLIRLPLAPLAVGFLVSETWWGITMALVLSLTLEATDFLDGWVARRYNAVTDFGKLFDPFSDAFARFTLFLGLWVVGVADLWMILVFFYRDSAISFFRSVAALRGDVVAARQSGKIKALVQAIGTNLILAYLLAAALTPVPNWAPTAAWGVMVVVTAVTAWSFVDYLLGVYPALRAAWHEKSG